MTEMNYAEALRAAMSEEMRRDDRVFIMGEDLHLAMAFTVTRDMVQEFGPERIMNTPICEPTIVGAAVGSAMTGMRPIAELMLGDLVTLAMENITNQAAKIHYMSDGQITVPLVVRLPFGVWGNFGPQHSQNFEAWLMHVPGLKVAIPSNAYDAKGLLKTAIRDDNPVMFCEHKKLYTTKMDIPDGEYLIPFGQGEIKREGKDLTIIATSYMVHQSLAAAEELAKEGIDALIWDPRTLVPFDTAGMLEAVGRTGRVMIIEEANKFGSAGATMASIIAEEGLDLLDAPIKRIGARAAPVPFSPPLEKEVLPDASRIYTEVKSFLGKA